MADGVVRTPKLCEWNPDLDRPSRPGDTFKHQARARVVIDWEGHSELYLCDECAALPPFHGKIRRPLT